MLVVEHALKSGLPRPFDKHLIARANIRTQKRNGIFDGCEMLRLALTTERPVRVLHPRTISSHSNQKTKRTLRESAPKLLVESL